MAHIIEAGERIGLVPEFDEIGNLTLTTANGLEEIVQTGSHLDTVVNGGLYDGAAGVVDGLKAIRAILEMGLPLERELQLVIWRGEESGTYDVAYKGNRAAFGLNPPDILDYSFNGSTLRQAIRSQGFDPTFIEEQRPTRIGNMKDRIAASLELHIEQADVLSSAKADIGIVKGVRGSYRFMATFEGRPDHTGATPYEARKDANLAMAYAIVSLDKYFRKVQGSGVDLIQSPVNITPFMDGEEPRKQGFSTVGNRIHFGYDVRSMDDELKTSHVGEMKRIIEKIADDFGVDFKIKTVSSSPGVSQLSPEIQGELRNACNSLRYRCVSMNSGAGHDITVLAKLGIPSGLIFIPSFNGSHNPHEYVSPEALARGASVLATTMYSLAK